MELFNPIWTIVSSCWGHISKHKNYTHNLEKNLSYVKNAMEKLSCSHRDVSRQVANAENNPRMVRTALVQNWLNKVETIEREVNHILQEGEEQVHNKCLGGCFPRNFRLSYKIGKQVVRYIDKVKMLSDEGHFDFVAFDDSLMNSSVEKKVEGLTEILIDNVVGAETTFKVVWDCVCNEKMGGVIGLYGMGGVGKTTLLKTLNNELFKKGSVFDLVIWIVASKGATVEAVQVTILKKLCPQTELWKDEGEDEKANLVYRILKVKRFIVMLDDLWEYLDVVKVGIPTPSDQNKSKIVFTTRSEEVCGQMGAAKSIKVRCLTEDVALSLFQEKVGESTLTSHPDIPRLAREVAMECDGLPLALITIGRAMASRKKPHEWEHAIQTLKTYPSKFSGMADHVLGVLKFSFDSLSDETVKLCFLYCSLFPEDYDIEIQDLVDLWAGEGFLDDFKGTRESRNYGLDIVETLKLACLLEVGKSDQHVKMHDVIRDMALWIACDSGSRKNRFLIRELGYFEQTYDLKEDEGVEKVSIWYNTKAAQLGRYPCILTGLIRESLLTMFPGEFFLCMRQIKVLDLSENINLKELPETIGNMTTLRYMNISDTEVRALPKEFRNLINLRYLLMDDMHCLEEVSAETISCLSLLRVFRISYLDPPTHYAPLEDVIDALENLQYINEISIYVGTAQESKKLESSGKLQRCMRNLRIGWCEGLSTFELQSVEVLESLYIHDTSLIQVVIHPSLPSQVLRNLHSVTIDECPEVINLNILVHAPNIQTLEVINCTSLKEVMNESVMIGGVTFSRLKRIWLSDLPCLASICPNPISSPYLEEVSISQCPQLRKIPFIPNTDRLREIGADPQWFNGLVWDDETAKENFTRVLIRV